MTDPRIAFAGLLAVVNPSPGRSPADVEQSLLSLGPFPGWPILFDHAARHRVTPLFAHRLKQLDWMAQTAFPLDIAERSRLERVIRDAAFAEMASLAELQRLSDCLVRHGVEPILLKGLALSRICFGAMGQRTNRDIDLLIRPDELALCDRLLADLGYVRIEPAAGLAEPDAARWQILHKDWVYTHPVRRTIVELHYRLFDNDALARTIPLGQIERVDLFGQHSMLSFSGDALLSYLALHGLLHSWSRLKWLIDYQIVRQSEWGAGSTGRAVPDAALAVRVANRLCDNLFGTDPPALEAHGISRTSLLVRTSVKAMADGGAGELEDTRFGTTVKNVSHYLISFRPSYWLAEIRYDLADTSRDGDQADGRSSGPFKRVALWIARKAGSASSESK